jgi:hypothetical protein
MKNYLTVLLLLFICQNGIGQDKLITKDRKQLLVKVIERTDKIVKYKMADYEDGPLIWVKINRLSSIEYKNGTTDLLGFQNPRKYRPIGISAGGALALQGGGGMALATADYFVNPQVDLEINIGTADITTYGGYFSAGGRFHLNSWYSEKRLTPFTGVLLGSNYGDGFCQIPVGINWLSGSGINASLSLNEMIGFNSWQILFAEVRVGWRFRL